MTQPRLSRQVAANIAAGAEDGSVAVRSPPGFAPPSTRSLDTVGSQAWRPGRKVSVALQILDVLEELGIDTVFGIPGGAISSIYGALLERPQLRLVTAKHESGAVFLAMGYAMATGRMALVLTTAGPGITNLLTGLTSAHYENVPLLVISGEVSTTAFGRGALQEGSSAEFDAVGLVRRCTRFAAQITRGESAPALVRKAIHASLSGRRGPSFLSLPLNVSAACQGESPPIRGDAHTAFEVDSAGCARAMRLLLDARRPLVLAGSGARGAASRAAVRRLAEASGAAVAVSPKAKSVFPEDHPLYLGIFGFGGHESVIQYLRDGVDVVLVCGSGLDDFSTNAWSPLLAARTAFIQIDIDTAQLGNNYPIDLGLLGPVEQVIEQMFREISAPPRPTRPCPGLVTQHSPRSPSGALTTAEVVLMMNDLCPADSVFTADMGEHLSIALHYLRVREQGEFITCLGFGSMGSGLCAAVGFQLGAPSRRVHAITGDGCFLMYGGELATAVQHQLPLTVVVINDSRLNMCQHGFCDQFGASPDLSTQLVDFAQIARGMGATAHVIRTQQELAAALAAPAQGAVLLDVRVDPRVRLEGSQRTAALRQFQSE